MDITIKKTSSFISIFALMLVGLTLSFSVKSEENACGEQGSYDDFYCNTDSFKVPFRFLLFFKLRGNVEYMLPNGTPPAGGWPTVFWFHGGAGYYPEELFLAEEGYRHTPHVFKMLLENGFAIVIPHAPLRNWMTNWPKIRYKGVFDQIFLDALITQIKDGQAGPEGIQLPLDYNNMFASGSSDGGNQADRMGRSWPGVFNAISIVHGSSSTCFGFSIDLSAFCNPPKITWDQAPILITHHLDDESVNIKQAEKHAVRLEEANANFRTVVGLRPVEDPLYRTYDFPVGEVCDQDGLASDGSLYCNITSYGGPMENPRFNMTGHQFHPNDPIEQCNWYREHLTVPQEDCVNYMDLWDDQKSN